MARLVGRITRVKRGVLIGVIVVLVLLSSSGTESVASTPSPDISLPPPEIHYVALGDSFSSGEGVPPFDASDDGTFRQPGGDFFCHRSEYAYSRIFARERGIKDSKLWACSGAKTKHYLKSQKAGLFSSVSTEPQQSRIDQSTNLVTITLGGNDVGFAHILEACAIPRMVFCRVVVHRADRRLGKLAATLSAVYVDIASRIAPDGQLAVLGYPREFSVNDNGKCHEAPYYNFKKRLLFDNLTVDLDAKIDAAVSNAAAFGYGVHFVSTLDAFANRELCSGPGPRDVNGLVKPRGYSFHPNKSGQAALADALGAAYDSRWLTHPPQSEGVSHVSGSGVIDLAIGLIFLFLVFSLLVSGANEILAEALGYRSRQLWRTIRQMLDGGENHPVKGAIVEDHRPEISPTTTGEEGDTPSWAVALYQHPLISQLEKSVRSEHSRLSQIPSSTFSQAMIDLLVPAEGETSVDQVEAAVRALPNTLPFRGPLLAIARQAGGDVDHLRKEIGDWFDGRMEALSATYKRHVKWVMLVFGLVVAFSMNVNAVEAARTLYRDQPLREAIVQKAIDLSNQCGAPAGTSLSPQLAPATANSQASVSECVGEQVSNADSSLKLPAGWTGWDKDAIGSGSWAFLLRILGWLAAAVALSQGAPFWFDLLRRARSLKSD
jgi:hypothetical protein